MVSYGKIHQMFLSSVKNSESLVVCTGGGDVLGVRGTGRVLGN